MFYETIASALCIERIGLHGPGYLSLSADLSRLRDYVRRKALSSHPIALVPHSRQGVLRHLCQASVIHCVYRLSRHAPGVALR